MILDDDAVTGRCVKRTIKKHGYTGHLYDNVIEAVASLSETLPKIIFMDPLLTGPDGFTLLNELASYPDTQDIPVVIYSEKDFTPYDLSAYHVVGVLNKTTMRPEDLQSFLEGKP